MCGPKEMMERIDSGEMKMVQASVTLVVPSYISHDMIKSNVREGVAFNIEEHLFFIDDEFEEVEDDVTLLTVTIDDVKLERNKSNDC